MDYISAIKYLEKATVLGSKRGHENLAELLELLGNPHKQLKFVHIAGTNGKGSVSAMLYSILRQQGYNTALFSSPHLTRYNERFSFNGSLISDEDFSYYIEKIKNAVEKLFKNNEEYFCFFEIMTAMAFCYFYDKKADYVILETGLGGRMDNTNIIENAIVSVICSISIDHTSFLGNTVEEIAYEKAGIIKQNCPVVLLPQKKSVYNVIKQVADNKNAPLYYVDDYNYTVLKNNFDEMVFSTCNSLISYDKIKLNLIGNYQILNACNALVAVKALKDRGVEISEASVYKGLEKATIGGRMEIVQKEPLVILDGAHNEGGIEQLCNYLEALKSSYKITLLFGVLNDKDYTTMLNRLYNVADKLVITKPDNKRALDCQTLAEALENKDKIIGIENDYMQALKLAVENTDDILICCGSIYLIGDIRRSFNV